MMMKTPSLVVKSMVVVMNKSLSLRMFQRGNISPPRRERSSRELWERTLPD